MEKKIAINLYDKKEYRFIQESENSYFVLAPNRRRYGWRYTAEQFFNYYEIKETKTTITENDRWKKRLKKAVDLCEKNDLWQHLKVVWENLYNYVTLEEKQKLATAYWDCDMYNRETGKQNYKNFIESIKEKYPFMIATNDAGEQYLVTDYIFELSDCILKTMYFGKGQNATIKEEIKNALENKRKFTRYTTAGYDVRFNYDPEENRAWYSEEYRDCANGHYYLALNENTAVFAEND